MKIEKQDLLVSAGKIGISPDQIEKLWNELQTKSSYHPLEFSNLFFYLGSAFIFLPLLWFFFVTFDASRGLVSALFGVIFSTILLFFGTFFLRRSAYISGSLFVTLAVCMIPLIVYGSLQWAGLWMVDSPGHYKNFFGWIKGGLFLVEVSTVIGGCIALYCYRTPFICIPIIFTLWFMVIEIVLMNFGEASNIDDILKVTSVLFGLGVLFVSYLVDLKSKEDVAFWPYFSSMILIFGGLLFLDTSKFEDFLRFLFSLGLMFISVLLQRKVLMLFGIIGVVGYVGSIFVRYLSDILEFPFDVGIFGLTVILLGIFFQKNHAKAEAWILGKVPTRMKRWLPRR